METYNHSLEVETAIMVRTGPYCFKRLFSGGSYLVLELTLEVVLERRPCAIGISHKDAHRCDLVGVEGTVVTVTH